MICLNPEHAKDKVTNQIVDQKSNECFGEHIRTIIPCILQPNASHAKIHKYKSYSNGVFIIQLMKTRFVL